MQGSHPSSLNNSIDCMSEGLSDGQGKAMIRLGFHKNRIISNDCSPLCNRMAHLEDPDPSTYRRRARDAVVSTKRIRQDKNGQIG